MKKIRISSIKQNVGFDVNQIKKMQRLLDIAGYVFTFIICQNRNKDNSEIPEESSCIPNSSDDSKIFLKAKEEDKNSFKFMSAKVVPSQINGSFKRKIQAIMEDSENDSSQNMNMLDPRHNEDDFNSSPVHKLLSSTNLKAISEDAQSVCFGFISGI